MTVRLGILISGRGSNFVAIAQAIRRGELAAEVAVVVSNRRDAAGLGVARQLGYPAYAVDHRDFATREEHESEIVRILRDHHTGLVCLAGYMRKVTAGFIGAYPERVLNIHPSLLPSFPGVDAQVQAFEHGARISGCTVHFVDASLDGGPILVQRCVAVLPEDTVESLSARILVEEHQAYVEAIAMVVKGVKVEGRRVVAAK